MIRSATRTTGLRGTRLSHMVKRMDRRTALARDLRWLKDDFEEYILEKRLPNQWRNRGVVRGKYGKGSYKWADNAPSTIKAKGFNKPMFSSRGSYGSSLIKEYAFTGRYWRASKRARNSRMTVNLRNRRKHAAYLHKGRSDMPDRWCIGFIEGDGAWLREHAGKRIMHLG